MDDTGLDQLLLHSRPDVSERALRSAQELADSIARQLTGELTRPLLTYFTRRVDNPADAADLLSEVLMVCWRRIHELPKDAEEGRIWAFGVAWRTLNSHRRSWRRRSALVDRLRSELTATPPPAPPYDELHAALDELDPLDPLDREIVRLVHWDGFTAVEVGRLLDMPEGTVRSRHARARSALKKALADAESSVAELS